MWFIGIEVQQETSAPPPKKILDVSLLLETFRFEDEVDHEYEI